MLHNGHAYRSGLDDAVAVAERRDSASQVERMRNLNCGIPLEAGDGIGQTICRRPERPQGAELYAFVVHRS